MPKDESVREIGAPTATVKRHGRLSPVWIIPIVAAGLVCYLAYSSVTSHGPVVTLTLRTADGLTVDQTALKHKNVTLGTVEGISLSHDMKSVIVRIRMVGDEKRVLTDRARFWVVRPRLTAGSLTGIETLVSGAYIEVDPGEPGGKKQLAFQALDQPPGRQSDEPGQVFALKAKALGSLSTGSPVYYRDVAVGEVLSYDLGDGVGPVALRIFVREPYDRFVHVQSRFWNASGLSVTMGESGLRVELQSIQTLLSGGIAFETRSEDEHSPAAAELTVFELFESQGAADTDHYRDNIPYVTYFDTSVQGLARGSAVQLSGVQVGSVTEVKLVYDPRKQGLIARVAFELQPERVLVRSGVDAEGVPADVRKALTRPGLHVVLESSSLLTGAKDLSLEYAKETRAPAAALVQEGNAIVLPSQGGGLEGLTASLADVATKLDKVPLQQIGDDASATIRSAQHLVDRIDTEIGPALEQLPAVFAQMSAAADKANLALGPGGYGQNSQFQHGMERLMGQMNDTARSLRVLTDYLDRHPEALLRGRGSREGDH